MLRDSRSKKNHETYGQLEWDQVMNEEYSSLLVIDTWDLATLSQGRKLVKYMCVYKTKIATHGSVDK